jgi:MFS transporter, FHS family, glucose/mannose:H+ symporter
VQRNTSLTPLIIVATYLGMLSIGAVTSSYGAALSVLRVAFQVGDAQLGLLGSAQTVGGVLGNLSTAFLERITAGQRMCLGALGFGGGAFWFAFAQGFESALVALFLTGLGLGLIQVNYAQLFSRGFGVRSSAVMTVMSTAYAVGSIAGPAIAALLEGNYRLLPIGFAALSALIAFVLLPARDNKPILEGTSPVASKGALGLNATAFGFAGMVLLYVVAEQGASFWGITHLESFGVPHSRAAYTLSLFWLALLIGRFVAAGLSLRFSSLQVLLAGTLGATLFLGLAHFAPVAGWAYIAAGFCLAPVFPAGLAWLARLNHSSHATTLYLVAGSLGAAVGIPLIGALKSAVGDSFIPTALGIASALCALAVLLIGRRGAHDNTVASARLDSGT